MTAKKAAREVFEVNLKDVKEHPGHDGIPDISQEGFLSLVESVRLNGVMEPVEILSEGDAEARGEKKNAGMLLDGRQRVRAAKECSLETVPAVYASLPAGMSTSEYVYLKASERRHLSKSQRAILAVGLKQRLGEQGGQGKKGPVLESFPEADTSRDRAGQLFGVSGRYITTAEKILSEAPDLAEQVRNGDISLNRAIRELNRKAGRTEKRTKYDDTLTAFKRFSSTCKQLQPSARRLPKREHDEIKSLVQQLEEIFARLGQKAEGSEPKKQERKKKKG